MAKARSLVEYLSRSNQVLASLKQQKLVCNLTVVVNVFTCWWSTFSMCERLVYLKQALLAMELDDQIPSKKVLTDGDWEVIKLVHKVLKPSESAMIVLEGENYVTVSMIPTVIKAILTKLRDVSNARVASGPTTLVNNLAMILLKDFRLRWLGDKESKFDGKLKHGCGRRQCGFH